MICIKCGFENREGELICQRCGALCAPPTVPISYQSFATQVLTKNAATPTTGTILMVSFVVEGTYYDYPVKNGDTILIGRNITQPMSPGMAILDLTQAGGVDQGISRKHAMVYIGDHQAFVSDLGSTNGTYLNGRHLNSHGQYPIYPHDTLRLGAMELHIKIA